MYSLCGGNCRYMHVVTFILNIDDKFNFRIQVSTSAAVLNLIEKQIIKIAAIKRCKHVRSGR